MADVQSEENLSSDDEMEAPEAEDGKPFNESFAGFTEDEFQIACKVISTLHYRRKLLSHTHFKPLLEKGKELFAPLSVLEKKKRRKERREEAKQQKKIDDQKQIDNTGMKKKKDREKKIVRSIRQKKPSLEFVAQLENRNVLALEDTKPEPTPEKTTGIITKNPILKKYEEVEEDVTIEDDYDFIAHHKDPEPTDGVELNMKRKCHICKTSYKDLHFFYHRLCPKCADYNFAKRTQTGDLKGKHILLTGGRLKIGYHITLMCLRAGCEMLHITTRFPKDCAKRLSKEKDWESMKSRVRIYGLDLRHIPSVMKFCDYLSNNFKRLDIIINNAAQTIRRPPNFFEKIAKEELSVTWEEMGELKDVLPRDFVMEDVANLSNMMLTQGTNQQQGVQIEEESTVSTVNNSLSSLKALQEENNVSASAILTMIPTSEDDHAHLNDPKHFPEGTDINNEQIDLRHKTTWTLKLHEVSLVEFMEVQTVNSTAPFVIVGKLREMMKRDKTVDKFIINVSSMEGQFYKSFKSVTHPHTNMAKASLNMMTRTSGLDYARDRIYMNSVDTGWVTNENASFDVKKFTPPLDEVDGAARVMDPIFESIRTKDCKHSLFYKDYKSVFW